MNRLHRTLLLLLLVLAVGACQKPGVPKPGAPEAVAPVAVAPVAVPGEIQEASSPEDVQPPVVESDFGSHLTLGGLIRSAVESQYFSWDSLLTPPPESFAETMLVQLTREPLTPFLAKGVSAFAGDTRGLAMALENGRIAFYSQWPCPGVDAPESSKALSWSPESRYLASLDQSADRVRVFDLQLCGEILKQDENADSKRIASTKDKATNDL